MDIQVIPLDDNRFNDYSGEAVLVRAQIGYDRYDSDREIPIRLEFEYDSSRLYTQIVWLTREEALEIGRRLTLLG